MQDEDARFMRIAIEEAVKGRDEGNYPVGSLVARGGVEVARGRNLQATTFDVTAHGETVALRNAGANTQNTDFQGHTLYTTLEPCLMCAGAIVMSGISRVVVGATIEDQGSPWGDYTMRKALEIADRSDKVEIVMGVLGDECAALLE